MKTKINFLKSAVLALALMGTTQIFAQTPGQFPADPTQGGTVIIDAPEDLNGGLVTFDGTNENYDNAIASGTVMFFRPTSEDPAESVVELTATLTDGDGNTFSDHLWYRMDYDQTAVTEPETAITTGTLSGSTNEIITITNLEPGYNKFRVRGETGTGISCPSDEYQDVIVFVLPPLDVDPAVAGTAYVYCENDVPTGADAIQLSATIDADYTDNTNSYPTPGDTDDADTDFALTYEWFAIPASAPTTTISLGSTATIDLSTLTTPLAPDTYTFYLDVEYDTAIRDKGTRTYVTYGGNTTATTQTVVVTATPGTPTITVNSVVD